MRFEFSSIGSLVPGARTISRASGSLRARALGLLAMSALAISPFGITTASAQTDPANPVDIITNPSENVYSNIPQVQQCRCVDLLIGDCLADVGAEPNGACWGVFWDSPRIWVRNQMDGFTNRVNQSPAGGVTNWVYIALHNRGTGTLINGTVHLYFAKASTGLYWPASWVGNVQPNCAGPGPAITYGDEVGFQVIGGIAPNQDVIVRIPWVAPDPANYCSSDAHHFCLLARFISPEDPMTYIEGTNIVYNTQYNNNIAWKNEMVLDAQYPSGDLDAHNGDAQEHNEKVTVDVPEEEQGDNVLNHVNKITIDLGADWKQQWVTNGGANNPNNNVEDAGGDAVRITGFPATIDGLTLGAGATANLNVSVDLNGVQPGTKEFHLYVAQYDDADGGAAVGNLVGGETVTISLHEAGDRGRNIQGGGHAAGTAAGNTLAEALGLAVHPNPSRGLTTISYTLPENMPITLAIYDVTGKLVRTLVAGAEQKAGAHTLVWDGTTADSKAVASGTYFYRIETPRGTAQQQLGITR